MSFKLTTPNISVLFFRRKVPKESSLKENSLGPRPGFGNELKLPRGIIIWESYPWFNHWFRKWWLPWVLVFLIPRGQTPIHSVPHPGRALVEGIFLRRQVLIKESGKTQNSGAVGSPVEGIRITKHIIFRT
jgi:hypothetical protein